MIGAAEIVAPQLMRLQLVWTCVVVYQSALSVSQSQMSSLGHFLLEEDEDPHPTPLHPLRIPMVLYPNQELHTTPEKFPAPSRSKEPPQAQLAYLLRQAQL
jgi:hypothetical protein